MLILPAIIIALLSLATLLVAWRGRRVDDHPLCRKCGYDLSGRNPDTSTCTECGHDLNNRKAIRHGHRERGTALGSIALLALMLSGSVIGVSAYKRQIHWIEYAPLWFLRHEMEIANSRQPAAFAEVNRRLLNNDLTQSQIDTVADRCLAVQADVSIPWIPSWGDFLISAKNAGRLSDSRFTKYCQNAISLSLSADKTVSYGNPLNFNVVPGFVRASSRDLNCLYFGWKRLEIDGAIICSEPFDLHSSVWNIEEFSLHLDEYVRPGPNNALQILANAIELCPRGQRRFSYTVWVQSAERTLYFSESDIHRETTFLLQGNQPSVVPASREMLRSIKGFWHFDHTAFRCLTNQIWIDWSLPKADFTTGVKCQFVLRSDTGIDYPLLASEDAADDSPAVFWMGAKQTGRGLARSPANEDLYQEEKYSLYMRVINADRSDPHPITVNFIQDK